MGFPSNAVLVTGSSGLTGVRLLEALARRDRAVVGVSRDASGPGEIAADLTRPGLAAEVVEQVAPREVVHLAGIATVTHPSPAEVYEANVVGTARLLEALAAAPRPPRLVIVASSAMVYAPPGDEHPIEEDHPLKPRSHYGLSKLTVEALAALYADRLPVQVVRPFNYTGPGQPEQFFVPKIVGHFARGADRIELGDLDVYRDVSTLDDVVETYLRLIDLDSPRPPLNICSGQAVHLRAIVEWMREIAGRSPELVVDPRLLRPDEPRTVVGSRARLDEAIGTWGRRPLKPLLAEMYAAARAAST